MERIMGVHVLPKKRVICTLMIEVFDYHRGPAGWLAQPALRNVA
jgi:hypothetical protein